MDKSNYIVVLNLLNIIYFVSLVNGFVGVSFFLFGILLLILLFILLLLKYLFCCFFIYLKNLPIFSRLIKILQFSVKKINFFVCFNFLHWAIFMGRREHFFLGYMEINIFVVYNFGKKGCKSVFLLCWA